MVVGEVGGENACVKSGEKKGLECWVTNMTKSQAPGSKFLIRGTPIIYGLCKLIPFRRIHRFVGGIELPDEKGCKTKDEKLTPTKRLLGYDAPHSAPSGDSVLILLLRSLRLLFSFSLL